MFHGFCNFGNWGGIGSFGAWGWIAMILQMVFWLGLIAAVLVVVMWAIRRSGQSSASMAGSSFSSQPSAKEILQTRYARGEITREQYELMKEDIG